VRGGVSPAARTSTRAAKAGVLIPMTSDDPDLAQRLSDGLAALAAAAHDAAWRELRKTPEAELRAALRDGLDAVARLAAIDPSFGGKRAAAAPHLDLLRRLLDGPALDDRVHAAARDAVRALGLGGGA
jgi:hypothetical protein